MFRISAISLICLQHAVDVAAVLESRDLAGLWIAQHRGGDLVEHLMHTRVGLDRVPVDGEGPADRLGHGAVLAHSSDRRGDLGTEQAGRYLAQQFVAVGEAVVEDTLFHVGFGADRPGGRRSKTVADQDSPGGLQQQFPALGRGKPGHVVLLDFTCVPTSLDYAPGLDSAPAGQFSVRIVRPAIRAEHCGQLMKDSGRAAGGEAARPLSFTTLTWASKPRQGLECNNLVTLPSQQPSRLSKRLTNRQPTPIVGRMGQLQLSACRRDGRLLRAGHRFRGRADPPPGIQGPLRPGRPGHHRHHVRRRRAGRSRFHAGRHVRRSAGQLAHAPVRTAAGRCRSDGHRSGRIAADLPGRRGALRSRPRHCRRVGEHAGRGPGGPLRAVDPDLVPRGLVGRRHRRRDLHLGHAIPGR